MDHILVDDSRLEVRRIAGQVAGPTLVLLHEGLGSVSLWRDFPDRLAEATGLPVLAYSRAGYGGSSPVPLPRPLDYMQQEAASLPRVLDALGLERVILVGHSDGASIALVHAGTASGLVAGVVAMAPHSFVEDICLVSIADVKLAYETTDLRDKLARHHGANVDVAFWGWNGAWLDPRFKAWSIREHLPGIKAPVLVIQGRQDEYGTVAQVNVILDTVTGARAVLLDDCRHSPHRDQPGATVQAVAEFVKAVAFSVK